MGGSPKGMGDQGSVQAPQDPVMKKTTRKESPSCLGRTCLKWSNNGELDSLDMAQVLERLAEVDRDLSANRSAAPDPPAGISTSD
jgi:hypothetical protein